jgi:hypothetical protein
VPNKGSSTFWSVYGGRDGFWRTWWFFVSIEEDWKLAELRSMILGSWAL